MTPKSKPRRQAIEDHAPWLPVPAETSIIRALQALQRGEADAETQKKALRWIVEQAAGTYDMSYRPGAEGQRDTDFAEGRRFVGNQIVKLLNLSLAALTRREHGRPSEQPE